MSFHFSLETVLWLRQITEEREERAMEEILRRIAHQRTQEHGLARLRERLRDEGELLLQRRAPAAEYVLVQGQIAAVRGREAECRRQLAKFEQELETQRTRYQAAHQSRELLSQMREQQHDAFRLRRMRQEQAQMDDVFSSRRAVPRRLQ